MKIEYFLLEKLIYISKFLIASASQNLKFYFFGLFHAALKNQSPAEFGFEINYQITLDFISTQKRYLIKKKNL